MCDGQSPAEIAAALADPVRLAILCRLLEGPAAVSELVAAVGEPQPKVSNHLAVLRTRGLVTTERHGRHTLYQLGHPALAQVIESLVALAGPSRERPTDRSLAEARTCYDHLAGHLGVELLDYLLAARGLVAVGGTRDDLAVGPEAPTVFARLGIDLHTVAGTRRRFAYACLDWTEGRPHLGGALGARLCTQLFESGWIVRRPQTRAVRVTARGHQELEAWIKS